MYTFRDTRPEDLGPVASNMRPVDLIECSAVRESPEEALFEGLLVSDICQTILLDDEVVGIWGLQRLSPGTASGWLLGTPRLNENSFEFARTSRRMLDEYKELFPVITNAVWVGNVDSVRWLEFLGAEFHEETETVNGVDFLIFTIS